MRTTIIFLSLFLTTALCTKSSFLNSPESTEQDLEQYSPKLCYPKIIGAYATGMDTFQNRSSMIPSELISNVCQNVTDSCCLDKEFSQMMDQATAKAVLLVSFRDRILSTIRTISSWNDSDKQKMLDQITSWEDVPFEKDTLLEVINDIKNNRKTIRESVRAAFRVIFENSAGLPCAICEAKNHSNFANMESRDSFKMVVDVNMCENLCNNNDFVK